MNKVLESFSEFNNIIVLTLSVLLLLTWIIHGISISKINKKLKKYQELTKYTGENSIEGILEEYGKKIFDLNNKTNGLENEFAQTLKDLKHYPQYHSIVRFNAFGNTGSDLSFAIALLDDNFDGIVISSIYGREESITYAKPIEKGLSTYHLTSEEEKAIQIAKAKKDSRNNLT